MDSLNNIKIIWYLQVTLTLSGLRWHFTKNKYPLSIPIIIGLGQFSIFQDGGGVFVILLLYLNFFAYNFEGHNSPTSISLLFYHKLNFFSDHHFWYKCSAFIVVTSCVTGSLKAYHPTFRYCDSWSDISIVTFALHDFFISKRLSKSKQGKITLTTIWNK